MHMRSDEDLKNVKKLFTFRFNPLALSNINRCKHQVLLPAEHEWNKQTIQFHLLAEAAEHMNVAALFCSRRKCSLRHLQHAAAFP